MWHDSCICARWLIASLTTRMCTPIFDELCHTQYSVLQGCTQVSWLVEWQVNWLMCSLLLTCHLTCQLTCVQTCQLTSQLTCHKCAALTCVQTGSTCCYDWQSTRVRSTWDRLIGLHIGLFCRISSLLYGSFAKRPVILSMIIMWQTH